MAPPGLINSGAVIGALLVGSGGYGMVTPVGAAHMFGLTRAGPVEATFYRGLAGRNVSAGLAVWALTAQGERRSLGTFLLCWMCTGVADTIVCVTNPAVERTWLHVMNTGILAVVGTGLIGLW